MPKTVLLLILLLFPAGVFTARADPGSALLFDGTNGYVTVPHATNFNAFPFTATAWFRTTNSVPGLIQGIVSKYADSSFNGWTLIVQGGLLRGFYYRNGIKAGDVSTTTSVADGFWHHAALVVDANGGKVYLDGVLVGTNTWGGQAGAPTGTQPLQIGRYDTVTERFQGEIDEVTVWNRALGAPELNYLKHRTLDGSEDGLVSLWHLDDNGGTQATDSTVNAFNGTLVSNPAWVASTAPIVFNQVAGKGLKFSGGADYVSVPHSASLDTVPLTLMAWVRTTRNTNVADGILSKYADGSFNGYTMFVLNGHLRAWYFRDGSHYVWDGSEGLDGGLIADGQWHHVAFVVDTTSGRLYVDGTQTTLLTWTGQAGPTSTTQPFQIGKYYNYTNSLLGVEDEVSIWNTALTPSQINTYKNSALTGTEPGLTALWRLNEGQGPTAGDLTQQGHDGSLVNNPKWIGSTAFLGDGTSVVHTTLGGVQWTRKFAVQTIPADVAFSATAPFWSRRLDDFNAPGGSDSVTVNLAYSLTSTINGQVQLVNSSAQSSFSLAPFNAATPQVSAGGMIQSPALPLQPTTQLASASDSFQLQVAGQYGVNGGANNTMEGALLPAVQLLHFDGNLFFGPVQTVFTSIANSPAAGAPDSGGVDTQLAVNNQAGYVVASPNHTYGNGSAINVILNDNGDAVAAAPTTVPVKDLFADTDCVQNICFIRTNVFLTATGATAGIMLPAPSGLSFSTASTNRVTFTLLVFSFAGTPLDGNLIPVGSLIYQGPIWAVEETKPFWMHINSVTWNVSAGQLAMPIISIQYVRQIEDDTLTASQSFLVDPNTARRISNDAYYRNAAMSASQAIVTANANGAAQLNTVIALNPPELRPHFPYATNTPGSQIPVAAGGLLTISNDLIDVANSSLPIAGAVPVSYSTDCTDTNCSGASAGPISLAFTPDQISTLSFTPDGGLLAYGSVPDTSLKWGYNGNGQYAQTAGDVQTSVFEMAGTFLRADQSTLTSSQLPVVLLFTGFGDNANPAYIERPGQANYPAGFANYPGLNFRTPPFGESYLAGHDTGQYNLAANCKYYVRAGGVSGIHQAASFTSSTLSLYGYPFTFTNYALSYLDSDNYESRTQGALVLPGPAGFPQEFSRMKFLCAGGLDSAELPSSSVSKHLAYWDVDITPQSIQFLPAANASCSTADRYLVMGVETRLPFIPQAFHATLGFKNTGNLLTLADNVQGVDSRFAVPGQMTLQGSGTSYFPLTAASDGYFNNWDNPNRPAAGFFTFAGNLRTPFFGDIKVQVHVTPSSTGGSPTVALMGGWPGAGSTSADRGWSVSGSNYFNTAKFDPQQFGYPTSLGSVDAYRNPSGDTYRPRAQRNWLDVAKFDYPLQWDPILRQFEGFEPATVSLPIIDVNSKLKQISPGIVDFDFAEDLSVQLPALKSLNFTDLALNELNGPLTSVSNALRQAYGNAADTTGLTSGFQSLQRTLNEDASGFFGPILQPALSPAVDALYNALAAEAANDGTNTQKFLAAVPGIMSGLNGQLQNAVQQINGATGQANSVIGKVNGTLNDVDDTIGLFTRILDKDNSGNRNVVKIIISKINHDQGNVLLGIGGDIGDGVLNAALQDVGPTLDEVQEELAELQSQFDDIKSDITSGTGELSTALAAVANQTTSVQQFSQQATSGISNLLAGVITPAGDYFTADPAAAKQALANALTVSFLSSPMPAGYQKTFREFFADRNFLLDQLTDVLFAQINSAIREALSQQIEGAEDSAFSGFKGEGFLTHSLLSAKLRGNPTFNGDSLRKIHLDANIELHVPDAMNFSAFMEIEELNSQTTPISCIPAGAPAVEVTFGAKHVPLKWPGVGASDPSQQTLTLDADARWTLQSGSVIGIGGTIDIHGGAQFQGCGLNDLGLSFAMGKEEGYIACRADATVEVLPLVPVDFKAGFFAGHSCSLDPLVYVDPDATKVLPDATSFSGVYIQYGGSLSLSQILLGESDCLLDVGANISTAEYFNGGPSSFTIGFRQKQGLDVSLLCFISGSAEFTLAGSGSITPQGPQLNLSGSTEFCGSAGPCPLCVSGCKTFTLSGQLTTKGVNLSFDY